MEYEKIARKYRKKKCYDLNSPSLTQVDYGKEIVTRLLPHRDPFLLVDSVTGIDLTERAVTGSRQINPQDPVFTGHFPDYAIYPGVLQVEMIGQIAICYYQFEKQQSTGAPSSNLQLGVRALKIYHTLFQHEVLPGDEVTLIAKVLDSDEYTFKGIGQVCKGDKICTIAIADFYIVQ